MRSRERERERERERLRSKEQEWEQHVCVEVDRLNYLQAVKECVNNSGTCHVICICKFLTKADMRSRTILWFLWCGTQNAANGLTDSFSEEDRVFSIFN
jgi:hypothetical protein